MPHMCSAVQTTTWWQRLLRITIFM